MEAHCWLIGWFLVRETYRGGTCTPSFIAMQSYNHNGSHVTGLDNNIILVVKHCRAHCMVHIQEYNLSICSSELGVIRCSKFVVLKFRVKGLDWKLKPPTLNSVSQTTQVTYT